jgi:hypothetical protein
MMAGAIYMETGLAGVARQPAVSLRTGIFKPNVLKVIFWGGFFNFRTTLKIIA